MRATCDGVVTAFCCVSSLRGGELFGGEGARSWAPEAAEDDAKNKRSGRVEPLTVLHEMS